MGILALDKIKKKKKGQKAVHIQFEHTRTQNANCSKSIYWCTLLHFFKTITWYSMMATLVNSLIISDITAADMYVAYFQSDYLVQYESMMCRSLTWQQLMYIILYVALFQSDYLVEYDGKTGQQFQRLWHDNSCCGQEHVPWACAHVAHDKNESGILQCQKHQTQVF